VIVGERVFVGGGDGNIYGLSLHDGAEVWKYEAGGGFIGSPAVADGKLLIASQDGIVYCFGAKE
jgi:outer membrane protein assembly factor BamB